MECPKGSTCTESSHEVKTLDKALEWYPGCDETDLPIRIEQRKGAGGRIFARIYNVNNHIIYKRG